MASGELIKTDLDEPRSFDGRLLIQIDTWEWGLFVGMSPESTPIEYRFQGGLHYTRAIEITGRFRAPDTHRNKRVRVSISPFGPELDFGTPDLADVGMYYESRCSQGGWEHEATLMLPESALQPALTCLGSLWRYVHIWVGDDQDAARISAFSFSCGVHPNLADWAGGELDESATRG